MVKDSTPGPYMHCNIRIRSCFASLVLTCPKLSEGRLAGTADAAGHLGLERGNLLLQCKSNAPVAYQVGMGSDRIISTRSSPYG